MTDYDKLKVADLKDLVKERGIASTGLKLKQQYIDALVAHDSENGGSNGAAEVKEGGEELVSGAADGDGEATTAAAAEDVTASANGVDEPVPNEGESTNKRKRRSPTPPLTEESVSKKLKTAEESENANVEVKLPEDVAGEAPAPVDDKADTIMPYGTSDDVMDVTEGKEEDIEDEAAERQDTAMDEGDEPSGPPSRHPSTRALYISGLVRPLQPNALREHLLEIAQPASLDSFHLDKLRSHALVLFDTRQAAIRSRIALHGKIWPDEPMRRTLWVDFVPDEQVQGWIDAEQAKADMTRWEVVYTSNGLDTDGPVTVTHQEAGMSPNASRKPSQMDAPSRPGYGEGMPNAPSGPRRRSTQMQAPPTPRDPPPEPAASNQLDMTFPHTQSKPKIYFKPVSTDLVDKRLAVFDQETSRDWDEADADPAAYAEGELRRYTFEDGDRLVDGGADFGLFGRRSTRGGRGGGRGRGGDYYRGGPRRR